MFQVAASTNIESGGRLWVHNESYIYVYPAIDGSLILRPSCKPDPKTGQ